MAEEDLIFGKNRHFFGGIEPSNMLAFSVAVESGVVKVTATLPNDTVVNNQTLCTVEGAIIRRKTTCIGSGSLTTTRLALFRLYTP